MSSPRQISMVEWTKVLVETVFSTDNRDKPVFLDLESNYFFKINEFLDLNLAPNELERIPNFLAADVRRHLHLDEESPKNGTFKWFDEEMLRWQTRESIGERENLPNWVPLLACFSLAAEKMGDENGLGIHNYYGRLCEIFQVSSDNHERFTASMHKSGHKLWTGLNHWLESCRGHRGKSTARQIGHLAHVGWSLSQALIRNLDRNRVKQFVVEVGYPSNYELSDEDAQEHLHDWLVDGLYQPRAGIDHLRRIFLEKTTRPYLVDLLQLFAFEGVTDGRSGVLSGEKISISSLMNIKNESLFPPKWRIDLQLVLDSSIVTKDSRVEIVQGGNHVKDVNLVQITDNQYVITIPSEEISTQSKIEKSFNFRLVSDGIIVANGKKPSVPIQIFREDEIGFKTSERLVVGQRHCVLINKSNPIYNLAKVSGVEIEELLSEISDGDFRTHENTEKSTLIGLPENWKLFQNVYVNSPLSSDSIAQIEHLTQNIQNWLSPLIPLKLSSILIESKYKIPGKSNTYLHDQPLFIRVFSRSANGGVFSISSIETGNEVLRKDVKSSSFELDLNHLKLAPGKYNVEFREYGHIRNAKFTLEAPSISAPFPDSPDLWWPMKEIPREFEMPEKPAWTYSNESQYRIIESGEESRCALKNHIWTLPMEHPRTYQIQTCEECGIKVRIPFPPPNVWDSPRKIQFKVRDMEKNVSLENVHALYDLLSFAPSLSWETLREILKQFGCSDSQDYWNAKMRLLAKGIIRVSSESNDAFEVCPPTINISHSNSRITMSGCWTSVLYGEFTRKIGELRSSIKFEAWDSPKLTRISYGALEGRMLRDSIWNTIEIHDMRVEFPSVFDALAKAQAVTLDRFDEYEYFDAKNTAWVSIDALPYEGLVRRRNQFPRHYYLITSGITKEVDMITGKHIAGIYSGITMFAYDSISECLIVPWGIQFSVAAENLMLVLGSSSAVPSQEKNALIYQEVSPTLAQTIISNTYRKQYE